MTTEKKPACKICGKDAHAQGYCVDCAFKADYKRKCECCKGKPVVMATGLCGPCTFGEAATAGGNWEGA